MHLDRDDTGLSFDTISTSFGIVEYKENREMVSIRGYVPGSKDPHGLSGSACI